MHDYKRSIGSHKIFWVVLVLVLGTLIASHIHQPPKEFDQEEAHRLLMQDEDYLYHYGKCTSQQKELYEKIYYTLYHYEDEVSLSSSNLDEIEDVFVKVVCDHPEFYYVNSRFQYSEEDGNIQFFPIYDYSSSEVDKFNEKIDQNTKEILSQVKNQDDFTRVQMIYEFIADSVEYQENEKSDQNIVSALVEKKSVCAGYARAYQYLLNRSQIESTLIIGNAKEVDDLITENERHAWIMIHMDDDYYYSDVTWGDVDIKGMEHVCYGYMFMNSDEMLKCYEPEMDYEKTMKNEISYFSNKSLLMENYQEEIVAYAIKQGLLDQSRVAEIKCDNEDVYQLLKGKVAHSYLVYDLLYQNDCWSDDAQYTYNDSLRLIEIYY